MDTCYKNNNTICVSFSDKNCVICTYASDIHGKIAITKNKSNILKYKVLGKFYHNIRRLTDEWINGPNGIYDYKVLVNQQFRIACDSSISARLRILFRCRIHVALQNTRLSARCFGKNWICRLIHCTRKRIIVLLLTVAGCGKTEIRKFR